MYDLVVIGAGSGGLVGAIGAHGLGLKVLLVEKHKVGGDCLNYGCVPSKAFLKTAKAVYIACNLESYGAGRASVKFDFKKAVKFVAARQDIIRKHENPDYFRKLGIDVELGSPRFIDTHTIEVNRKKFSAKKFLIATGSRPFEPEISGAKETGYVTNEQIFSLPKQPGSLLVVGGGPIGTELSQIFARIGTKVTVVEKSDHILNREDNDVALMLMDKLEKEGIQYITNASLTRLERKGKKKLAVMNQKGKEIKIEVDEILLAIGRRPNVEGLNLENIGVKIERGIIVDKYMRTSVNNIFAVGDVVGPYLFTHTADYQAGIALNNMISPFKKKADYTVVPWTTFTDPELARVGYNEKDAKKEGVRYELASFPMGDVDRAIADNEMTGKVKLLIVKGRLIGATILGPNAGEYVHECVLAMQQGIPVKKLYAMIHVYPTYAQSIRRAISKYMGKKYVTNRLKKVVRWLF